MTAIAGAAKQWYRFKTGRVNWRDHFCCSRNLAAYGKTVVIPCGGRTVFLEDARHGGRGANGG